MLKHTSIKYAYNLLSCVAFEIRRLNVLTTFYWESDFGRNDYEESCEYRDNLIIKRDQCLAPPHNDAEAYMFSKAINILNFLLNDASRISKIKYQPEIQPQQTVSPPSNINSSDADGIGLNSNAGNGNDVMDFMAEACEASQDDQLEVAPTSNAQAVNLVISGEALDLPAGRLLQRRTVDQNH